jgi:hypothetical protein
MTPPHLTRISRTVQLLVLLVAAAFLVCLKIDSIWTSSSDFAHHYALIARISEHWILPPGIDPSLGEMNIYPRASHNQAAILGILFGSPIIGMQLLTLLSMIAVWTGLIMIVLSLPQKDGVFSAAVLATLLIGNAATLAIEFHGVEVIGNFFFSQLVAQGYALLGVMLVLYMEKAGCPAYLRRLFLIGCIYLGAGMHLLPSSELLLFLTALIVLELWTRYKHHKRDGIGWIKTGAAGAADAAFVLAAVLVLVRHPAFTAMKEISNNNGDLSIKYMGGTVAIAVFCLLILASSAVLIRQWIKLDAREGSSNYSSDYSSNYSSNYLALKYLGLYGAAAAGLCLVQLIALKLGHGSEYAVKKHMFALNTVLLMQLSLLPILFRYRRRAPKSAGEPDGAAYAYLLPPALLALALTCVAGAAREAIDTSDLVALEHKLLLRRDVMHEVPGKFVYVEGLAGVPATVDYMMTIGLFGTPRTANSLNVLRGQALTEPALVGTIITSPVSIAGKMLQCRLPGSTATLALMDGACVSQESATGRTLIGLASGDGPVACAIEGFGDPETTGRWTIGKEVWIKCAVPTIAGKASAAVELEAAAFLENIDAQRALFSVNGSAPVERRFDRAHPKQFVVLDLPPSVGKRAMITISLPDATSPKALGLSEDQRELGLRLKTIKFK